MDKEYLHFIWAIEKEIVNVQKHGISFIEAAEVFKDENRKIISDENHSQVEERFFCIGHVNGRLMTVRFTYRKEKVRIIGAGYWRKGYKYYNEKNS